MQGWREWIWALELLGGHEAQEPKQGTSLVPKPTLVWHKGTVSELGNAGSQLTETSAIPAPASIRNECGPELTIFIFN